MITLSARITVCERPITVQSILYNDLKVLVARKDKLLNIVCMIAGVCSVNTQIYQIVLCEVRLLIEFKLDLVLYLIMSKGSLGLAVTAGDIIGDTVINVRIGSVLSALLECRKIFSVGTEYTDPHFLIAAYIDLGSALVRAVCSVGIEAYKARSNGSIV